MKILKQIAYVLLIIGGLSWGIYGLSGHDLIDVFFGPLPMVVARIIYILIGISAVYVLVCRLTLYTSCNGDEGCECEIKISTSNDSFETKTKE